VNPTVVRWIAILSLANLLTATTVSLANDPTWPVALCAWLAAALVCVTLGLALADRTTD
jgi:hypothetical protein